MTNPADQAPTPQRWPGPTPIKPGTIAKVLCSDGQWRRAIAVLPRLLRSSEPPDAAQVWVFADNRRRYIDDSFATPLAVIDPVDDLEALTSTWRWASTGEEGSQARLQQMLRMWIWRQRVPERPARIPEPSTYGVVEAGHPRLPGSHTGARCEWMRDRQGVWRSYACTSDWESLVDPRLIRAGIDGAPPDALANAAADEDVRE